jgi:galactose oxidase-like protein
VPRHYHGNALLLPDGRVAVAGHTMEFNRPPVELNRFEVEVVAPPYLFRGPRPLITSVTYAGSSIGYGQNVTISTDRPAEIARAALIRAGSSTHQLNTDQRYVGLAITQRGNSWLAVTAPPDGGVAPPGYYMLFLVDDRGVPSQARFVRVG